MNNVLHLPEANRLEQQLRREMSPGEQLLWSAMPDPKRMKIIFGVWLFAVPWTAFALFWTGAASSGLWAGHASSIISWIFPLWGLPFIGVGLWMLSMPFSIRKQAKHMIFGITNQRVLSLMDHRKRDVRSVSLDLLGPISRKEGADGWGDVTIETGSSRDSDGDRVTDKFQIFGVPDVARVERMLREAQQQFNT